MKTIVLRIEIELIHYFINIGATVHEHPIELEVSAHLLESTTEYLLQVAIVDLVIFL